MTRQRTTLLAYGGCLLGILVGALFLLLPLARQLQASAARLDTARKQQVTLLETTRETSLQKRTIESLRETGVDFSAFRVTDSTIVDFLNTLDVLAARNGVSLVIENLPPPSTSKQSTLPISLQGTLPSILSFLQNLEAQTTYLAIKKASFSPIETNTSHPVLTATLIATLTWQ